MDQEPLKRNMQLYKHIFSITCIPFFKCSITWPSLWLNHTKLVLYVFPIHLRIPTNDYKVPKKLKFALTALLSTAIVNTVMLISRYLQQADLEVKPLQKTQLGPEVPPWLSQWLTMLKITVFPNC